MFTVELICFGNELLIGKTINTNATWLGKRLITLGGQLKRITTCPDILEEMKEVIKETLTRKPDVIITTGGMGTTFDDLALSAVAQATNKELLYNEEALTMIKNRLDEIKKSRNIDLELTEERKRMALIPDGAKVLRNRSGSAPGVFLEVQKTKIFIVPGVPREMEAIFDFEIVNFLPKVPDHYYFERSLIVYNVPESELATAINEIRNDYPSIYFKTHPKSSSTTIKGLVEVELHLTFVTSEKNSISLDDIVNKLIPLIKQLKGIQDLKPNIVIKNEKM